MRTNQDDNTNPDKPSYPDNTSNPDNISNQSNLSSNSDNGLSTGGIFGIVIGSVALTAIVGVGSFFLY